LSSVKRIICNITRNFVQTMLY